MANTTNNGSLANRIEELVREHIAESHRTAQDALERAFAGGKAAAGKGANTAPIKRRASGHRRQPEEVAATGERLYAAICADPGKGMALLARGLGVTVRDLSRPMMHLKKAGRIRSVGQRDLTKYFPMALDAAPGQ